MSAEPRSRAFARPDVDVVVVGAGFAGLYLLYKLRSLGFTAVVLAGDRKPDDPLVMASIAEAFEDLDDRDRALEWVERAFRLSPRDPLRSVWYGIIGRAEILLGEDERALETARKGIVANPKHPHNYAVLASGNAHLYAFILA